jgi:hypothetical protein
LGGKQQGALETSHSMKKRTTIIGFMLMGLVAIAVMLYTLTTSTAATRPVGLVITGPVGQRFSGRYVADGVTNSVQGIAPTTVGFEARDVTYEFKRDAGDGEFRVALYVGDLCRTSTTSDKRQGVRGVLRYASVNESYWAAGF